MKNICKLLFLVALFIILTIPKSIYAQNNKSFDVIDISNPDYCIYLTPYNFKLDNSDTIIGIQLKDFTIIASEKYKDKLTKGLIKWLNPDYVIKEGEQIVEVVFYSGENSDVVTMNVYIYGIQDKATITPMPTTPVPNNVQIPNPIDDTTAASNSETISDNIIEDIATPSLTATSLTLVGGSSFDINVDNKEQGNQYSWTSSNPKAVRVNSKSGIVTAVSDGDAKITCNITSPSGETTTLTTDVSVGLDEDNMPILTEDSLNLEVGEMFDVDVENKIKGCSYRFVSSDKSVAKVTSTTGKITGLKVGNCIVRCIITDQNKNVYVLKTDVTIE
jgi:hypothetical protein